VREIKRTPLAAVAVPIQTSLDLGLPPPPAHKFFFDKPAWDDRAVEAEARALVESGREIIPPSRYPLLKSYNGATGQERRDGGNLWAVAMKRGMAPREPVCSVCTSRLHLQNHNENYFRPCNARPVCSGCHRLLHRRFYQPNPWLARVYEHRYEGAWFTKIALVELTREQSQYLATLDDPFDVRQL
jgi:hypothetical protein